jgi:hypothetical protein
MTVIPIALPGPTEWVILGIIVLLAIAGLQRSKQ